MATRRLLLIDESDADRSLAAVVLRQAFPDAELAQVAEGSALFTALQSGRFHAVITELGVREASWGFVLDAIGALQPEVPIVVFSRQADPEIRAEVVEAGAAAFVAKSSQGFLDLQQALETILATAMSVRRAASQPGASMTPDGWREIGSPVRESAVPNEIEGNDQEASLNSPGSDNLLPAPLESFVAKAHRAMAGSLRQTLGVMAGVVVVSAVLTLLISSAIRGDGSTTVVEVDTAPSGEVLSEHVENVPDSDPATVEEPAASPTGSSAITTPAADRPTERPPFRGSLPVTLEIRALSEVWVLVSLDGRNVLDKTLSAGETHVFQGRAVAGLRVGNAAGLQVFWNGTDIGSLGGEGRVRRLYFTPDEVGVGAPPVEAGVP